MLSAFLKTPPPPIPEYIHYLPNISGWEKESTEAIDHREPIFLPTTNIALEQVTAAFAIALHLHQPLIPAGANGELISYLQYLLEHPCEDNRHHAEAFILGCRRMAEMIPDLVAKGYNPRIMLDYSGTLLWGLRQMGWGDILEDLKPVTLDPDYQPYVEWLGTTWSHAVIASTPIPDIKLQIEAWQHHFAAIFGWGALSRVRGFSPPKLQLPNHPDTLFAFVKALKECGYRWILVREDAVETLTGQPLQQQHLPHRLIARNSGGETLSITALIQTPSCESQFLGPMQPHERAKTLNLKPMGAVSVPPLAMQIGDGEDGGAMVGNFPGAFYQVWEAMQQQGEGKKGVVGLTGTEYLELIQAAGCSPEDYPPCQAAGQHYIWERVSADRATPEAVASAIADLQQTHPHLAIDRAAWTNRIAWVGEWQNTLTPQQQLSALFHQTVDPLLETEPESRRFFGDNLTKQFRYREALLHNLLLQDSWFEEGDRGVWSEYAQEIYRRGEAQLRDNF
jgi:hypothetical protein